MIYDQLDVKFHTKNERKHRRKCSFLTKTLMEMENGMNEMIQNMLNKLVGTYLYAHPQKGMRHTIDL